MITWIIISVVLYLLGIAPVYACIDQDKEFKEEATKSLIMIVLIFWFLFVIAFIISELYVWIKAKKIKKVAKCLIPLLFISLVACNDGGSEPPDFARIAMKVDTVPIRKKVATAPKDGPTDFKMEQMPHYLTKHYDIEFDRSTWIQVVTKASGKIIGKYDSASFKNEGKWYVIKYNTKDSVLILSTPFNEIAYLKYDSAWVVKDSALALRMLLRNIEAEFYEKSKLY